LSDCNKNYLSQTKAPSIIDWFIESSGLDDNLCHYVVWFKAPIEVKRLGKSVEQRFYPLFDLM